MVDLTDPCKVACAQLDSIGREAVQRSQLNDHLLWPWDIKDGTCTGDKCFGHCRCWGKRLARPEMVPAFRESFPSTIGLLHTVLIVMLPPQAKCFTEQIAYHDATLISQCCDVCRAWLYVDDLQNVHMGHDLAEIRFPAHHT